MAVTASWNYSTPNLTRAAAVVTADPFLIHGWGWLTSGFSGNPLLAASRGGTDGNNILGAVVASASSGAARALTRDTVTAAANSTTTAATAEAWGSFAGQFYSSTSRAAMYNGGARGTGTDSRTVATQDGFRIGGANSFQNPWNGAIASVSVWNLAGLSSAESISLVERLAEIVVETGYARDPRSIDAETAQPWTGKLVAYWRLKTNSDLNDLSGNGHHLTANGTITTWSGTAEPVADADDSQSFIPDVEPIYYGGNLLTNKTNIQYLVTAGHSSINGAELAAGINATTDASGILQLPAPIGEGAAASDPVTLALYFEEGNPAVDRSIIVKTTLVAA